MLTLSKNYFRVIWALIVARNKEFYRDRSALAWSLIFPACIVAAIAIAFSEEDQEVFRVGVYQPVGADQVAHGLLDMPYITRIDYKQLETGLERVRQHQLDLLLSAVHPEKYWVNDSSSKGAAVERLLLSAPTETMVREPVSGREVRYIDWVIPGVLGMNVMFGALFGIGFVIVRYRKNGVLKRLQVTPVTRLQFLTAQVISRLVVLLVSASIVYVGCHLFLDFVMLGSYFSLFLIAFFGIFAMIAAALIVASRTASEEFANGLLNFLSFPMMLLSEVWFSLDNAPQWLVMVSQCLPLTHLVQAARDIMINGASLADVSHHLWILILMCGVFLSVGALLFRWNEQ